MESPLVFPPMGRAPRHSLLMSDLSIFYILAVGSAVSSHFCGTVCNLFKQKPDSVALMREFKPTDTNPL